MDIDSVIIILNLLRSALILIGDKTKTDEVFWSKIEMTVCVETEWKKDKM